MGANVPHHWLLTILPSLLLLFSVQPLQTECCHSQMTSLVAALKRPPSCYFRSPNLPCTYIFSGVGVAKLDRREHFWTMLFQRAYSINNLSSRTPRVGSNSITLNTIASRSATQNSLQMLRSSSTTDPSKRSKVLASSSGTNSSNAPHTDASRSSSGRFFLCAEDSRRFISVGFKDTVKSGNASGSPKCISKENLPCPSTDEDELEVNLGDRQGHIASFSLTEKLKEVQSCCVSRVRNFSIIAHVDHGKSSISDAILKRLGSINPFTKTQFLDSLGKHIHLPMCTMFKRNQNARCTSMCVFEACEGARLCKHQNSA